MEEVIRTAVEYLQRATVKCKAHYLAARISSKHHKKLGIAAIIMNAIVGSAVFVSLNRKAAEASANLIGGGVDTASLSLLVLATIVAVAAAITSYLQTFLGYAERAEHNRIAAVGYERLQHRLDLFLLRYRSAQAEVRDSALKDFEEILREFDEVNRNSPPIADSLLERARNALTL